MSKLMVLSDLKRLESQLYAYHQELLEDSDELKHRRREKMRKQLLASIEVKLESIGVKKNPSLYANFMRKYKNDMTNNVKYEMVDRCIQRRRSKRISYACNQNVYLGVMVPVKTADIKAHFSGRKLAYKQKPCSSINALGQNAAHSSKDTDRHEGFVIPESDVPSISQAGKAGKNISNVTNSHDTKTSSGTNTLLPATDIVKKRRGRKRKETAPEGPPKKRGRPKYKHTTGSMGPIASPTISQQVTMPTTHNATRRTRANDWISRQSGQLFSEASLAMDVECEETSVPEWGSVNVSGDVSNAPVSEMLVLTPSPSSAREMLSYVQPDLLPERETDCSKPQENTGDSCGDCNEYFSPTKPISLETAKVFGDPSNAYSTAPATAMLTIEQPSPSSGREMRCFQPDLLSERESDSPKSSPEKTSLCGEGNKYCSPAKLMTSQSDNVFGDANNAEQPSLSAEETDLWPETDGTESPQEITSSSGERNEYCSPTKAIALVGSVNMDLLSCGNGSEYCSPLTLAPQSVDQAGPLLANPIYLATTSTVRYEEVALYRVRRDGNSSTGDAGYINLSEPVASLATTTTEFSAVSCWQYSEIAGISEDPIAGNSSTADVAVNMDAIPQISGFSQPATSLATRTEFSAVSCWQYTENRTEIAGLSEEQITGALHSVLSDTQTEDMQTMDNNNFLIMNSTAQSLLTSAIESNCDIAYQSSSANVLNNRLTDVEGNIYHESSAGEQAIVIGSLGTEENIVNPNYRDDSQNINQSSAFINTEHQICFASQSLEYQHAVHTSDSNEFTKHLLLEDDKTENHDNEKTEQSAGVTKSVDLTEQNSLNDDNLSMPQLTLLENIPEELNSFPSNNDYCPYMSKEEPNESRSEEDVARNVETFENALPLSMSPLTTVLMDQIDVNDEENHTASSCSETCEKDRTNDNNKEEDNDITCRIEHNDPLWNVADPAYNDYTHKVVYETVPPVNLLASSEEEQVVKDPQASEVLMDQMSVSDEEDQTTSSCSETGEKGAISAQFKSPMVCLEDRTNYNNEGEDNDTPSRIEHNDPSWNVADPAYNDYTHKVVYETVPPVNLLASSEEEQVVKDPQASEVSLSPLATVLMDQMDDSDKEDQTMSSCSETDEKGAISAQFESPMVCLEDRTNYNNEGEDNDTPSRIEHNDPSWNVADPAYNDYTHKVVYETVPPVNLLASSGEEQVVKDPQASEVLMDQMSVSDEEDQTTSSCSETGEKGAISAQFESPMVCLEDRTNYNNEGEDNDTPSRIEQNDPSWNVADPAYNDYTHKVVYETVPPVNLLASSEEEQVKDPQASEVSMSPLTTVLMDQMDVSDKEDQTMSSCSETDEKCTISAQFEPPMVCLEDRMNYNNEGEDNDIPSRIEQNDPSWNVADPAYNDYTHKVVYETVPPVNLLASSEEEQVVKDPQASEENAELTSSTPDFEDKQNEPSFTRNHQTERSSIVNNLQNVELFPNLSILELELKLDNELIDSGDDIDDDAISVATSCFNSANGDENDIETVNIPRNALPKPDDNVTLSNGWGGLLRLFGITCFSFLKGKCAVDAPCRFSHTYRDCDVVKSTLELMADSDLCVSYKFICRCKILFRVYMKEYCAVYAKKNMQDKLINMMNDCERYDDCSELIQHIFSSLTLCGLSRVDACKEILRVSHKNPCSIAVLVSIIVQSDWTQFVDSLLECTNIPSYRFRINDLQQMALIILRENDSLLLSTFFQCLLRIHPEDIALVQTSPVLLDIVQRVKSNQLCELGNNV